ncbi:flagellar protein FlaG [Thioalkalivibrio sp. ALJ24]|uniref:flagellar protein FlaG n=1 Tax=Thioalkalivibrio sp. ALJ24 TaxID=545276 RepID=UPI000372ED21|nr:flagellar protein FlaG [Thioalkalivibrio sp. ALJ24]
MTEMINNSMPGAQGITSNARSGESGGGRVDARGPERAGGDTAVERQGVAATVDAGGPGRQGTSAAEGRESGEPVEASDLAPVVESINAYLQNSQRTLEFSVDESSGRTVITVMDGESEEIIRQIPPEQMLALAEHFENERDLGGTGFVDKA